MDAHHVRTWPTRLVARPWLLVFVPVNAATAGFAVVLPLLILVSLHASWESVAIAATLFNVAVVMSSIVWGRLSDRIPKRRLFLTINFAGFALIYALIGDVASLPILFALYVGIGLLTPAGVSASNLLILEKFAPSDRANGYASFQEMTILGSLVGLLLGYFWIGSNASFQGLLYVLAALALVSAVAVWLGVKDPTRWLSTIHVAAHPEGLLSRLRHSSSWRISIPFFPARTPEEPTAWTRLTRWVRAEVRHELPLIIGASFLFNLSANLFNISYTPYLVSVGIGSASIFLVNFANNAAQGIVFPVSGGLTARRGPDRLVLRATYVRALGYLAVAMFTLVPLLKGSAYGANLVAFAILGGAIALYATSSTMILFRGVEGRAAGNLLGINSAFGGVAAILGAGLSWALSFLGSFTLVFLVSAGALLVSLPLWTAAHLAYARRNAAAVETPVATETIPPEKHAARQTD